jgi:hypothetical protein
MQTLFAKTVILNVLLFGLLASGNFFYQNKSNKQIAAQSISEIPTSTNSDENSEEENQVFVVESVQLINLQASVPSIKVFCEIVRFQCPGFLDLNSSASVFKGFWIFYQEFFKPVLTKTTQPKAP